MTTAVQNISALDRALTNGKSTPILTHILTFADAENNALMGLVNKAFQGALYVLMGRVCTQLSKPYNQVAEADTNSPLRLATKYDETIAEHARWIVHNYLTHLAYGSKQWKGLRNRIELLKDNILGEQDPIVKNRRSESLCIELTSWQAERQTAIEWITARGLANAIFDENWPLPDLYHSLQKIIAQENMIKRFCEITRSLNPQARSYNANCLAAFHKSQREGASSSHVYRRQFMQLPPYSFSPKRFLQGEEIATNAGVQADAGLLALKGAIEHDQQDVLPSTPQALRFWFRNEQNDPRIKDRINVLQELHYVDLYSLPAELWRCRNLRSLHVAGTRKIYLSELPPEMENLTRLTELDLAGNRFQEIPNIIGRLQNLQHLNLRDTQIRELPPFLANLRHLSYLDVRDNRIRTLPDAIYQHVDANSRTDRYGLLIDQENLTHLPFGFSFQEQCRITLPKLDWGGFECILYALLSVPVFIYNHILIKVVEAVITLIRDILCYDRMIEVDR